MKIIYLHDPKAGASVLPQLEETFPMLEIVAIDLEDDFEKQFKDLKALFSQFTIVRSHKYAIIADGFGIAYASFFKRTWTKGQEYPTITILLNPDYRTIKDCETYKKIPQKDIFGDEVDCLNHFNGISIFTYENYHTLSYHQQHYGGNYLLLSQITAFLSIKDLIEKSAKGRVTINYLKTPILTPRGQILPPDYPLISVYGSFEWFGEKLFNARIPTSAFQFRDNSCIDASTLYLIAGDIIEPYPNENCNYYKYLANGDYKNITTGEIIKGQSTPNFNPFGSSLPDWQVRWLFKELVTYKFCIPFDELKNGIKGFDKYGHKFILKAIDYEAQFLWEDNINKGAIQQRDKRCDNYVAGVFPKSDTPDKIFLLPYNYEGIMAFKSSGKRISGYPIAEVLKRKREEAKADTRKNESTGNE